MMKTKPVKKFIKALLLAVFFVELTACTRNRAERLYEQAYQEIEKGHYRIAADLLIRSAETEEDNQIKYRYMTEAARIVRFEIQDYERALRLFRRIILESDDPAQRLSAQESVAEIELESLQNYPTALRELQKLEPLLSDTKKKEKIRLRIAQTLYLTGQYQAALEEISAAEKYMTSFEANFLKLKAEVYIAEKKYKEAIALYDELRQKFPDFFKDENLYISTSIAYEENEMFSEALNYLNKYKSEIKDQAYLELRLKRLKERLVNKPLFKGIRK